MEDSKKRSRHLVGSSEASPARDFRLALFVFARARVVSLSSREHFRLALFVLVRARVVSLLREYVVSLLFTSFTRLRLAFLFWECCTSVQVSLRACWVRARALVFFTLWCVCRVE